MNDLFQIDIFPLVLTLLAFRIGQKCQEKWKKPIFNPTLIGMAVVVAFLLVSGMEAEAYQAGASKLSWLMTPATICLAIPMYEQFRVLRSNLRAILAGVAAGAAACAAGLLACGLLLHLPGAVTVSLMPKSVTTAIAVPLSQALRRHGRRHSRRHHCHRHLRQYDGTQLLPVVPDHGSGGPGRGLRHGWTCDRNGKGL